MKTKKSKKSAFTVLEVMVAIMLIATLSYLLAANVPKWLSSGEDNRMKALAANINSAAAQYYGVAGRVTANSVWKSKTDAERYVLIKGFLFNPPATLEAAVSEGYRIEFATEPMQACKLYDPEGEEMAY